MNKKKKEGFDRFIEFLLDSGAVKAERIMMTMDDEEFMKYYAIMMEYAAPKQQRVEQETKQDTVHRIVVNWDDNRLPDSPSAPALESGQGPADGGQI
jgi:hypothetical protein